MADDAREVRRAAVRSGSDFDSEFRIRSASGAYRLFQTRTAAIRDEQATILKWYATSADVDHLKREGE
ncbi:MAG TPA: PAS domain-containing protein [Polyangiales bacterium]|nr:PAS domain-containing protein [Polyangiales bacterium]